MTPAYTIARQPARTAYAASSGWPAPGRDAAHRVAEPCRDVELVEQLDQDLRLHDVGDRLDGDEVGLRGGEQVEPPSVEVAQVRSGDAVVASILRAVGEEGAVGTDGRSDEWTGPRAGESSRTSWARVTLG